VILHCAERPVRDVYASGSAKRNAVQGALAPRVTDWLMEKFYIDKQKSGRPANHSDDALYQPTTGLQERGRHPGHVRKSSVYAQASLHPLLSGALVLGAGLLTAALVSQSSEAARANPDAAS
jgi:hypothetical protein